MTLLNIKLSNGTKRLVKYKAPNKGTVVIGGRTYPTVKIGNQWWMAENLDWKIDGITIGSDYITATEPHAWYYNNDESAYGVNGNKYGLLYNWYCISIISQLIPTKWRVPSTSNFDSLFSSTGGSSIAGKHLKSVTGWDDLDGVPGNGDNLYGFNALPVGLYDGNTFSWINKSAVYWTSNEDQSNIDFALRAYLNRTDIAYNSVSTAKGLAFSLRLVKDAT